MEESKITLKSINDLLSLNFYVPSYQRGYRWDEKQVVDLLNDINDFKDKRQGNEFYCLQPLIVKKDGDKYRLIDGQQRLTTIYIILAFLGKKRYQIEYETRIKSKVFLENINGKRNTENIDFYHMSNAYSYVEAWFDKEEKREATVADEFYINLGKYTKVIWYEIPEHEDEIDVFTRINSGKISLTEAELVKALFLNRKNFDKSEKDLKQIEIAKEWDEIEYALQNDEFWFFLNPKSDSATRISLVLDIFCGARKSGRNAYRHFSEQKELVKLWAESPENIKKVFLSLRYWFDNRELYHLIGFIIARNKKTIDELYQVYRKENKSMFRSNLYKEVTEHVDVDSLEELDYNFDKDEVFDALLLFNVATLLNNGNSHVRFAYDKFNTEKWSIEHIHAQQDTTFRSTAGIKDWLSDVLLQVKGLKNLNKEKRKSKEAIIDSIEKLLKAKKINGEDPDFRLIQKSVFALFGDESDVHTIDNLALLSSQVNSSLSNNIFPIKREVLIDKDKSGEFIPICTKNVFLKYYSKRVDNLHFWNSSDRKQYLREMKTVLKNFSE